MQSSTDKKLQSESSNTVTGSKVLGLFKSQSKVSGTAVYSPDGAILEVQTNRRAPNRESYCTLNSQNINAPEL